jgi:hypothetical protein
MFPVRTAKDSIEFFQDDVFFQLAFEKEIRVKKLVASFNGRKKFRIIFSYIYRNLAIDLPGVDVEYLPEGYFNIKSPVEEEQKAAHLAGTIVMVNSGDAGLYGEAYAKLYSRCNDAIFVLWDQDNHHWLDVSIFVATHSDAYVPLHFDNLYALSRYNQVIMGPVAAGTIQWTSMFLREHLDTMVMQPRSNETLGKHVRYERFPYRNKVVITLNKNVPSIDFTSSQFHNRSAEDRLAEWSGYKSHWIVPVLNDIPQRLFDAMMTGGIPIVPESMRFLAPISEIRRDCILFYGAADIFEPTAIISRANAIFDEGGEQGIVERCLYALEMHHADSRIKQILAFVAEKFELSL